MESDDEVDIEGECDLSESTTKCIESQSELLQHPWVLEQGWSTEVCTDEKSKALIDTMLWEEQQYLSSMRRVGSHQVVDSKHDITPESTLKPKTTKKPWTEEQKQLFLQGLEIFGRKWKKIAEIIPGRTDDQVKHYGIKYFKKLKQEKEESGTKRKMDSLNTAELSSSVRKKGKKAYGKLEDDQNKKIQDKRNSALEMFPGAQIVRITKDNDSDSEEIDIDLDIDTTNDKVEKDCSNSSQDQAILLSESPHQQEDNCAVTKDCSWKTEPCSNTTKSYPHVTEFCSLRSKSYPNTTESCSHLFKSDAIKLLNIDKKETDSNLKGSNVLYLSDNNHERHQFKIDNDELEFKLFSTDSYFSSSQNSPSSSQKCGVSLSNTANISQHVDADDEKKGYISSSVHTVQLNSQDIGNTFDTDIYNKNVEKSSVNIIDDQQQVTESRDMKNVQFQNYTNEEEQENQNTEESTEDEHTNEFPVQGSDGKIFYLQNPAKAQTLDPNEVTAQEKEVFLEFFDGRPGLKYADKYVEIRNSILNLWEKGKPNYLAKTVMRNGLKKCRCDVNLLGRIHTYLEQIGAINFGCEQVQYKNKKKRRPKVHYIQETNLDGKYNKEALSKRRRKVRDMFGMWVDPKLIEGRTIDHDKNEVCTEVVKLKKKRNSVVSYDPFKLIPCQDFGVSVPAPFEVVLDIKVLILMDIHAHMSKTEVIGLLGGVYNGEEAVLKVLVAEPCESLSTGIQCEMDPVSQTEASEKICDQGFKVVGWYHSHPTFEPNPSVRDIETQENFQTWFSIGKNPFIGMIVSPYCLNNNSFLSLVRCLIISKSTKKCADIGLPFQFHYSVTHNGDCFDDILRKVELLIEKNIHSKNKVEMLYTFKQSFAITCLEKLCKSLKQYFIAAGSSKDKDLFFTKLTELITESCSAKKVKVTDT